MNVRLTLLIATALLVVVGCDSSTEPEQPKPKTGFTAELAIDLPLAPSDGDRPHVDTEWWVIQGGELWFHNLSQAPIDLELVVTNPFTSESNSVGDLRLDPRATDFIRINEDFTTSTERLHSWALKYATGDERATIALRFGP